MNRISPFPQFRFFTRYNWVNRKKCLPLTSLATSCLLRVIPSGTTSAIALAISGLAHSDSTACCFCRNVLSAARIGWSRKRKGRGEHMQVIVIQSPKALRGILRRLFGIKKEN